MASDVAGLIERDHAAAALDTYTSRLCELLRSQPDRDAPAVGVWTLGDVAKHVTSGIENYALWMQGSDAPDLDAVEKMPQWNVETVRRLPPADLTDLAERIEAATDRFLGAAHDKPEDHMVRWYAGNRIPVGVAVCMRLVEAVVHGYDVARAADQPWHIDPDTARAISYGLGYIAPHFVDRGQLDFVGTIRIRIRGGADLYYTIRDRELRVATSGPSPGWHLIVEPVAWVLVSTGRKNQWLAALHGDLIGWGTRPRLPFRLRAASFQG